METKKLDYDVKFMSIFIKSISFIFRWLCLVNCILYAGFTVALLVMYMVKGNNLPVSILSSFVDTLTKFKADEVAQLVDRHTMANVIVASTGYGFALAVYNGLVYSMVDKFIKIYNTIVNGKMFTKENVELINKIVPESIIAAFVTPLIIFAIYTSTKILGMSDINMSGILFVFAAYVAKLVFEHGYEMASLNDNKKKEIAELKATLNEEKMNMIKKENEEKKQNVQSKKKKVIKKSTNSKKTTSK